MDFFLKYRYIAISPWYHRNVALFVDCVFDNFNGSQESWMNVCGVVPAGQLSSSGIIAVMRLTLFTTTGQSIFISVIYIPYYIYLMLFSSDHVFVNLRLSSRSIIPISSLTFSGGPRPSFAVDLSQAAWFPTLRTLLCCLRNRSRTVYVSNNMAVDVAPAADEQAVDESGVDPKDIALVVDQAHCTRAEAVTALRSSVASVEQYRVSTSSKPVLS